MRKSLVPLLMASALIPATVHAQDETERGSRVRAERSNQDDDGKANRAHQQEHSQRPERAPGAERANGADNGADRSIERAAAKPVRGNDVSLERRQERAHRDDRPDRVERPIPVQQEVIDRPATMPPQSPGTVQTNRRAYGQPDSLLEGFRRQVRDQNSRPDDRDHDGRDRDKDHDWSKDWRKNDRYDWWNYRNRYRSLYRLGRYNDPYGWGYRRWSIGYNMWPSHYGSNFWLNDPWMYRLPPAYGPYRWVRYYDDALLVNIYTGNVVDVVYNFFW